MLSPLTRWTSSRTMPKRCRPKRFHRRRWRRHHRAAGSWKKMPGFSDPVDLLVVYASKNPGNRKKSPVKRSWKTNWFIESVWYMLIEGHARWDEWKSSITRSIYDYIYSLLYIYIKLYIILFFFWYLYPGIYVITWMGICRGSHEGLVWDSQTKNVCNVFLGGHLHPGK